MAYRITIEDLEMDGSKPDAAPVTVKVYEQVVPALDLRRVIDAINYKPRIYTKRAKKGEQA